MRHQAVGPVSISGAVITAAASTNGRDSATPTKRELRSWPGLPDENDLTMALRVAMEVVEEWQPGSQGESSTR
jgi:hypothetical protein